MISTWIRDLFFLFIFMFLCCHYDCIRNTFFTLRFELRLLDLVCFFCCQKLTKIWIWLLVLRSWQNCILWSKVRSWFQKKISVSRVFNHSSIIVGNTLERTFILPDVSPFINSKFSPFYSLLNFLLSYLDDPNQIWLLKSLLWKVASRNLLWISE